MSQTRLHSAIESATNFAIGYGVAVASQIVILPLFGVHLPLADNLVIGEVLKLRNINPLEQPPA